MKCTPLRADRHPDANTDFRVNHGSGPSSIALPARTSKHGSPARSRLGDPDALADAIAQAAPFSAWPREVLMRLAAASSVSSHRSGTHLIVIGQRCDTITIPVEGTVLSSVSNPGGRRIVFKFDDSAYAYGLAALVDGLALPHDLVAEGPVTVIRIPHATIRTELARMPALWESIAVESNRRGRGVNMQMQQFAFDAPMVRAASLLLGMMAQSGNGTGQGSAAIELRLSQERLAELLGTSRQWATALVRELSKAGLVEWRYGRATVLDVQALRSLAARGVDAMAPRREPAAMPCRSGTTPSPTVVAVGVGADADAGGGARRRTN